MCLELGPAGRDRQRYVVAHKYEYQSRVALVTGPLRNCRYPDRYARHPSLAEVGCVVRDAGAHEERYVESAVREHSEAGTTPRAGRGRSCTWPSTDATNEIVARSRRPDPPAECRDRSDSTSARSPPASERRFSLLRRCWAQCKNDSAGPGVVLLQNALTADSTYRSSLSTRHHVPTHPLLRWMGAGIAIRVSAVSKWARSPTPTRSGTHDLWATTPLRSRPAWSKLEAHAAENRSQHLRDIFRDPTAGSRLAAEAVGIY